jgi:hypothetical protein
MRFSSPWARQSALHALLLFAWSTGAADETATDTRPGFAPDIREDETAVKVQRGNFVAVPVPISNPTLDTGLVAGAAYFYPQSEEEKKRQPASLTAAAGMYTSNDSRALGVAQQNYWKNDQWRFTGVVGAVDLRLSLLAPDDTGRGSNVDWRINGNLIYSKLSRRLKGDWYGGAFVRFIDANQSIDREIGDNETQFEIGDATSVGVGVIAEYDSRDMPLSSYTGRHLKIDALFNDEAIGSNQTYQSYGLAYRSYHRITDSVVLAWEVQGCKRGGKAPLWDACLVKLRGFSATDYLGRVSASGQIEARWQMSSRWGLAGFAGSGYVGDSFAGVREREPIPSFGAGIRFMVLPAKRINIRLDYARSKDSDAIHFSVGEAF